MPAAPYCRYEFAGTDALPPEERFAFWRDNCLHRIEPHKSAAADHRAFSASVRELIAPEGRLADFRVTASSIARSPRLCRADGINDIILSVALEGGGRGWFGEPDRTMTLTPGMMRVRDEGRPYAVEWTGTVNRTLHVDVPRARFDAPTLARIAAANGMPIPIAGLARVFAAQARALAEVAPDLSARARVAGLRGVIDLAAAVLGELYGPGSAENELSEDGLVVAAQALIQRQFATPHLSPAEIARQLGCSRAHLYRIFARHGLTVSGYLRNVRLERSQAALAVAAPQETIGDIAFRCGFEDPVHFARLFHQRFGLRPKEARQRD